LQKEVQICVVGKVFRPNKSKVLALNKTLGEYLKIVKWYLSCNSKSKKFLHEKCYEDAKRLFNLNTALIQTARDKAVEICGCINIARRLMRSAGWGSCGPPNQQMRLEA
jgi:hypothetical protein